MLALARHFARLRSAYPTDRLLVVFEIDGPIVDQRHIVRRRLLDYDRVHGTDHFGGVEVADVDTDAGNLEPFLIRRGLAAMVRRDVLDWYREQPSSPHHAPGTGASPSRRARGDPLVPTAAAPPSSGSTRVAPSGCGPTRCAR